MSYPGLMGGLCRPFRGQARSYNDRVTPAVGAGKPARTHGRVTPVGAGLPAKRPVQATKIFPAAMAATGDSA
ncbi:hypothetical protein METHP14_650024 [Pseudomonas sp. P14-2025]